MQIEQLSEHIWKLSSRIVIPISVWLVKDKDGLTLIDTGIGMMSKKIIHVIEQLDAGPLQRILLTHGHPDHTGGLRAILKNRTCPVYAHQLEIPYIEGEKAYPGKKKAKRFVEKEILSSLQTEDGELSIISGLKPYLTPGHSPGHVVYYHQKDSVLIAGDLFTSQQGELRRPYAMFTPDMAEAVKSGAVVEQLKPACLSPCHGKEVFKPNEQYGQYFESWEKTKRKRTQTG